MSSNCTLNVLWKSFEPTECVYFYEYFSTFLRFLCMHSSKLLDKSRMIFRIHPDCSLIYVVCTFMFVCFFFRCCCFIFALLWHSENAIYITCMYEYRCAYSLARAGDNFVWVFHIHFYHLERDEAIIIWRIFFYFFF